MMEAYSVLMSVYFKEKAANLKDAIDSMLKQTVPPTDFVLVCDGPLTPELDCVVTEFTDNYPALFQIIRLPENRGLGEALRIGMQACKNDIVARMDSDDIALPERMEWQIAVLNNRKDISAVGGQIQEFFESEERPGRCRIVPTTPEEIKQAAARRNPMNHMTVTFRKEAVMAAGGYMSFDRFEDYYLWIRMLDMGFQLINIDKICVYARVDMAMYQRRGGWDYFKQTMKLERCLIAANLCSRVQFVTNVAVRFCGTVLLPNRIRQYFYLTILRNREL